MFPINLLNIIAIQRKERDSAFNIERRVMKNHSNPFALRDDMFKKTFHLTKDMAHFVHNLIEEHNMMYLQM